MEKTKFLLGQTVIIESRLVNVNRCPYDEQRIRETGEPEYSAKYSIENFDSPKQGIVVGVRSVVKDSIHYLAGDSILTKTNRQAIALVACDLRGIRMVPLEMVHDLQDWEFESGQDITAEELENIC